MQVYFQRNKQICPNEVSKELDRTVWDVDECLRPICFTFPSPGSVLLGPFWEPHSLPSSWSPVLAQKKDEQRGKPVNWLRIHPALHIPNAKATWAENTWTPMVDNRGRSGCGAEQRPLVYSQLLLLLGHASTHCHENRRRCGCALFIVFSTYSSM